MSNRVLVVAGPTASGKSGLAAGLAARLGGTVINADSLQLYRGLPVLTAQPGEALMAMAPHRLYGVLDPMERSSAAAWVRMATAEIAAARAVGRVAVVTGGTGLYLEALMLGLPAIPEIPNDIRHAAEAELAAMGRLAFARRLIAADPLCAKLDPANPHRLLRAWLVWVATGRSLFAWQEERRSEADHDFTAVLLMPPRERLHAACDARFAAMAPQALEEVRQFARLWPDIAPAARALGFRELAAHSRGEISLEMAVSLAQAATRHYAKRQATWFRNRWKHLQTLVMTEPDADRAAAYFTMI